MAPNIAVVSVECQIKPRLARETSMKFPGGFFKKYIVSQRKTTASTGNQTLLGFENTGKLGRKLLRGWKRVNQPLLADSIKCLAVALGLTPHSPHQGGSPAGP